MFLSLRRPLLAAVLACTVGVVARPAGAQVRPTPDQARALLQSRPDLIAQLRDRLLASGLTREQIHARLRAEGYPEDILDPYLSGSADSTAVPTSDVFSAVQALGVVDTTDVRNLRAMADSNQALARLGMPSDTSNFALRVRYDSVALARTRADSIALRTRTDSGFMIFGLDVFKGGTSQFQPNLSGPVDANYRLGPGDQLVLILTGDVEQSYSLPVTREGFVVIPQVGQLYVANLTLGQLEDLLYSRLGRVYSGVRRGGGATTRFSVSVSRLRANQVFVVGDVGKPGSYQVSSAGTALTALYAAGGPSVNGSLRDVEVRRGGKPVDALDVYDYLLRGDASHDVRLETGDVVFVPVHGARARILGQVVRPATYELKPTETLSDLITDAGGFTPSASRRRIQIERILPPEQRSGSGHDRVTIEVSSDEFTTSGGPRLPIEPGDVVHVFEVADRVRNRIAVQGDVWAPGSQGLTPGMKIADAIRAAGGPKPDVYLGQLLVSRLQPDSTRIQLRAALRDSSGAVLGDFPLREDDIVQLFSETDFRPVRFVAVNGAVRRPGRFPFRAGMTVRDLVLEAGGLEERAYLKEAEIARLPESREGGVTAQTIRVPLDSTYLFDYKPGQPYLGAPGLQAMSSGAPEVPLRPYDNLLIMQQPDWELQRTVAVNGEVRFPGSYALKRKSERLSDLLERAGGFTQEAYPEGIIFTRTRGGAGRIAVDVRKAQRRHGSADDLLLMDGDAITIPTYSSIVTIRGAVNAPNTVAYVRGKDLDYYIRAAGGGSRNADLKRAYVTQPNGKRDAVETHWFQPNDIPVPLPGSVVVVPEKDPADKRDYVAAVGAVASVLASLVAIVVVLARHP